MAKKHLIAANSFAPPTGGGKDPLRALVQLIARGVARDLLADPMQRPSSPNQEPD
jgi:hypothetical protein